MKKVPFSKIKPGKFCKIPGYNGLWQRARIPIDAGQCVSGKGVGSYEMFGLDTPVTPVNATIVINKE